MCATLLVYSIRTAQICTCTVILIIYLSIFRTDPASNGWASTWMSGIALAILGISLISGAIFALFWARKNKRNMKAAYPGNIWEDLVQFVCFKHKNNSTGLI